MMQQEVAVRRRTMYHQRRGRRCRRGGLYQLMRRFAPLQVFLLVAAIFMSGILTGFLLNGEKRISAEAEGIPVSEDGQGLSPQTVTLPQGSPAPSDTGELQVVSEPSAASEPQADPAPSTAAKPQTTSESPAEPKAIPAPANEDEPQTSPKPAALNSWNLLLVNPWNLLPKDHSIETVTLKNGLKVDTSTRTAPASPNSSMPGSW